MKPYGIHWFRRDLRVNGNPALGWNWKENHGRVLGVFFFDAQFLARADFSHVRFLFFLKTLAALKKDLENLGGSLLVLDSPPLEGFKKILGALDKASLPSVVSFNRDYEPYARERDHLVEDHLKRHFGAKVHTERDHLLIEPWELKKENSFYQIYTPFARKWFQLLDSDEMQKRINHQANGFRLLERLSNLDVTSANEPPLFVMKWNELKLSPETFQDKLEEFLTATAKKVSIPIPEAGAAEGLKTLELFKSKLNDYATARDFPAESGTSRISRFLKNGSLTVAQVIHYLKLGREVFHIEKGSSRFLKELVWREFYYHILYHCPHVETSAFNPKFRDLRWENNEKLFEAWKTGRTGYPIVDAGMRELNETGHMHNRVRMIVASFLTKDLLIDWKWGERYFMEKLIDGDLAANNGGWQWAASTGCDPQPYFRVFNPTLQSEKFDPDGVYIKRFLPERRHLSGKALHAPINPIVDHAERKEMALRLYAKEKTKP